jgi:hypothetical protein
VYDDGDEEDYSEDELEELIKKHKERTSNTSANKRSEDSDASKSAAASDSDGSDDPFSHLGRTTNKRRKIVDTDSEDSDESFASPEVAKRKPSSLKKTHDNMSDSDESDYFSNKKKKTTPKKTKPKVYELDSESDSDVENLLIQSSPKKKQRDLECTNEDTKIQPSPRKQQQSEAVRADSEKTLEDAKKARENLQKAQNYHAEELEEDEVDVEEVDDDSSVEALESVPAAARAAAAPLTAVYTGSNLKFTLRYKDLNNNTREVVLRIKSDEPLHLLKERFQRGSIISLKFEGQQLNLDKTPQFYEMEDDDLLDAVIQVAASATSSRATSGDVVKLLVRRSGTSFQHEFGIPKMAELSKLVRAVCDKFKAPSVTLQYNGRALDPLKSCHSENIPNNSTIDAVAEKTIKLEFRVNGNADDTHTIHALHGTFQHAMEAFAAKKNCAMADCKFVFDGDVLQPNTKMEDYEVEDGDLIDVKMTVAGTNAPVQNGGAPTVARATTAARNISVKTVRNVSRSLSLLS